MIGLVLQYGRLLWKNPECRARLLRHWMSPEHPHSDRFQRLDRPLVERILVEDTSEDADLDADFRGEGHSFRTMMREIPPVFGRFY